MTISFKFNGVWIMVEYGHSPAQLQTFDDPGFDEEVEIQSVHVGDHDITGLFESFAMWSDLEDATLEAHRDRYADKS